MLGSHSAPGPVVVIAAVVACGQLIDARGIGQAQLADEAQIALSTISEMLNGNRLLNRRKHIESLSMASLRRHGHANVAMAR